MVKALGAAWAWISEHWGGLVALCALVLTVYELRMIRRHNQISFAPAINKRHTFVKDSDRATIAVQLANHGLGPAILKKYEIFYDGKPIERSPAEQVESVVKATTSVGSKCNCMVGEFSEDYMIPAGCVENIVSVEFPKSSEAEYEQMFAALDRFDIAIEYESVYGVRQLLDTRKDS